MGAPPIRLGPASPAGCLPATLDFLLMTSILVGLVVFMRYAITKQPAAWISEARGGIVMTIDVRRLD
jgi:hypothetical protein